MDEPANGEYYSLTERWDQDTEMMAEQVKDMPKLSKDEERALLAQFGIDVK